MILKFSIILLTVYTVGYRCNDNNPNKMVMKHTEIEKLIRNSSSTDIGGLVNLNFQLSLDNLLSQIADILSDEITQEEKQKDEKMESKTTTKPYDEKRTTPSKYQELKDETKDSDQSKSTSVQEQQPYEVFVVTDTPVSQILSRILDSEQQPTGESNKGRSQFMEENMQDQYLPQEPSSRVRCPYQKSYWRKC